MYSAREYLLIDDRRTKRLLGTYYDDDDQVYLYSNTINILISRDIQKNCEVAVTLAMGINQKFEGMKTLLINTYAGRDLMQEYMAIATQQFGAKIPKSCPVIRPIDTADDDLTEIFPGFWILDVPFGAWDSEKIGHIIREHSIEVAVLDSFEFAAVSRGKRERIACDLLQLHQELGLSLMVCSHEMKKDLQPRYGCRGAIGILSAFSDSVTVLLTPWEEKRLNQVDRDILHEQKTLAKAEAQKWTQVENEWKARGYRGLEEGDEEIKEPNIALVQRIPARVDDDSGPGLQTPPPKGLGTIPPEEHLG